MLGPRRSISFQRDLLASKAAALLYYYEDRLPVLEEPSAGQSNPVFYVSSALGDTLVGRFEVCIWRLHARRESAALVHCCNHL
jgi:hypothetical protein